MRLGNKRCIIEDSPSTSPGSPVLGGMLAASHVSPSSSLALPSFSFAAPSSKVPTALASSSSDPKKRRKRLSFREDRENAENSAAKDLIGAA
jgi:hypothetical protein